MFEVKVREGQEEAFLEQWHKGSIPIQKMPGAMGTLLHKKIGVERTYIAIPEWKSQEARQRAMAELDKPENLLGQEMRKWGDNSDFGEVRVIAEMNEIDRVFPPKFKRV